MVTDVKFEAVAGFEVISLDKIKKHLRIETSYNDEDDLIQSYLEAAIEASENYMGGHIVEKDMVIKLDSFDSPLVFEAFPLQSIASVKYFYKNEDAQKTMDPSLYALTSANQKVYNLNFKESLPELKTQFDAVTITLKVGFVNGKVPKTIVQAVLLKIGDLYERREDRSEMISLASQSLLRPYKKF
jgi:uncharacterized phiE125 gp8 family phage protein